MAAAIVLTIIGILVLVWLFRVEKQHHTGRKQFLESLEKVVDRRISVEEWERFLHSPIVSNPRLEAARGCLIRLDDKYERADGESISAAQCEEMRLIYRELETEN